MDSFEQQSANNTEVAAAAIEFSSLYSVLQRNYEGNSIPSVITQLLHMYQPEDDIIAYERVLKKVQGLLEDCDSHKKQLLLSMIPIPKNALHHKISDVFRTTTGFAKLDLRENDIFQNTFGSQITNTDGIASNGILSSKQNFSCNKSTSDTRLSLAEGFPFRGFAESEISTTFRSHVRNVKRLYGIADRGSPPDLEILIDVSSNSARRINRQADPSDDNSKKYLDKNNQYQTSTYRQYLLNKRYYAPAGISSNSESHLCFSSQTVYQGACSAKTRDDTKITADKIPRQFNDVRYGSKKCNDINVFDKDTKCGVSREIIDIGQNATTVKETIKDKIHRMDVCRSENHDIVIDADDLLAAVSDGLKASLRNFLKRAQEGTSVELSAFPRTRSYPQMNSSIYLTSEDRKPTTARKISKNFASDDGKSCLLLQRQNANVNLGKNNRALDERTRQKALSCIAGSQTKCGSRELDKATESPLFRDDSDCVTEKKAVMVGRRQDDTEESTYGCKMIGARSNDVNLENDFQACSMSEIAAYKKQYYNTLLSVQRAKVAVTNSLASSSDRLTAYDDPYYSGYACQRQHLFQRQRRCAMGPQFSSCPSTVLSGLPGAHGDQYSWARSDCKYLLLKQLRLLRRQTSPVYARNQDGWIHHYVGSTYSCPFALNGSGRTKQYVRRKSLEDIVGKLKDTQ